MHTRERRFRYLYCRIHRNTAKCIGEQHLDLPANCRCVFLARDKDKAREETPERITAQEQLDALTVLEVENSNRGSCQVLDRTLEQLFARKSLDNVQQGFAAVAEFVDFCPFVNLADLVPDKRDFHRAFAVRNGCEQADKPPFPNRIAIVVINFDADVIQKCLAMHRRARIGFRQNEPVTRTSQALHFCRQLDWFQFACIAA